jgi:hypothetical protein
MDRNLTEKIQMKYSEYIDMLINNKKYTEMILYDQSTAKRFLVYSLSIYIKQKSLNIYKITIGYQEEGGNYHDAYSGSYLYDVNVKNHELVLRDRYLDGKIDLEDAIANFF